MAITIIVAFFPTLHEKFSVFKRFKMGRNIQDDLFEITKLITILEDVTITAAAS